MSIEGSSTVAHHKPAANNTSRLGKGKGAADGELEAPDGAGIGFLALLNSFDPNAVEEDPLTLQMAMDQPAPTLQPLADPLPKLLPQDQLNDLQLLLAQANEVTGNKFPPLQAIALEVQSPDPLNPTVALTTDFSTRSMPMPFPQGLAGNFSISPRFAGVGDLVPSNPKGASAVAALALSGGGIDTAVPMDLSLVQTVPGSQLRSPKNKIAEGLSGVGSAIADARIQNTLASVDIANREIIMTSALMPSGFSEGLARPNDRNSGKSSFLLAGSGSEGIWGQPALRAAPALDVLGVATESSAFSLESVVADTVSYWVTQGVKNAALKLDGFGEHPLEVNISMQGAETHIDFRTDQPEIRQILEGAIMHLKDLLKSEGVILSGVSVGASGQNGGGSQDARDQPGSREGTVATIKPASVDSPRIVSLPAGRVLDLFV